MLDVRSLWDFNDPAGSEARFRKALESAKDDDALVLKTQIARTFSLRRMFTECHAELDALPPFDLPPVGQWQAYALLERGRCLNSSGNKLEARTFFENASLTEIAELRIDALHMIAIVAEPAEALEINERAIAEAQASDDPSARRWLGSLLNNTAWSHHDLGNFQRAYDLFVSALEFRQEQGDEHTIRIAKWSVGRSLRSLNRFEEALALQMELLSSGHEDGYLYEEIGECLWLLGRPTEAVPYFRRAFSLLSEDKFLAENEAARLKRLWQLSGEGTD